MPSPICRPRAVGAICALTVELRSRAGQLQRVLSQGRDPPLSADECPRKPAATTIRRRRLAGRHDAPPQEPERGATQASIQYLLAQNGSVPARARRQRRARDLLRHRDDYSSPRRQSIRLASGSIARNRRDQGRLDTYPRTRAARSRQPDQRSITLRLDREPAL